MRKIAVFFCLVIFTRIDAQIITTFAGSGTAGYSNGTSANTAKLNYPYQVAIASNGNIYIADQSNNLVRMVDPAGTAITTVVGYTTTAGYSGDGG
ncbi:MAG TPA: hypothetical protein VNY73_09990, partial [Bacteroidia bacterium]|nr:hypothetical protein [Bacteroidia bacterium]